MTTSFFMRRPVQRNYAAKAAYGPRGEQGGRTFPYSTAQGRVRKRLI